MSSTASRIQANLKELFQAKLAPGDAYIRFQLTSDITALLSMAQVQESLVVNTEKINALPNMSNSVIGIMSSRNRVFCVFDLAQLLNLSSPLIAPRQYQVIVLQTNIEQPIYLGLAVSKLQGMMRLNRKKIQTSLNNIDSNLTPYLSGVVQEEFTTIPILGFERILISLNTIHS